MCMATSNGSHINFFRCLFVYKKNDFPIAITLFFFILYPWMITSNIKEDKSFADDLNLERGIVSRKEYIFLFIAVY